LILKEGIKEETPILGVRGLGLARTNTKEAVCQSKDQQEANTDGTQVERE
jgi:hypothetical protein